MIQDPAGLLHRIPELKPLCEDPGVRHAVEQGDPFRLYRALRWARWLGRLRSHRETIDALLRNRRLFARPLKGNLWLGTLNGFGATLLGSAEPDSQDGTHISTHCVVALFAIPLLPLGAYVVRPAEGSTALSRSWAIFARVPMGPLPWLWSRALALGVIALVALGAAQTFMDSRYQDVRLINGFPKPLRVELAGLTQTVPPYGMAVLSQVPVGRQQGRAVAEDGYEVDKVEIDVSSGFDVHAWNISGAAPIYRQTVIYSPSSGNKPPLADPDIYCGRKLIALKDVDYAFTEPPDSLKMSKSQGRVTRSHVAIGPQEPGRLPTCLGVLASQDKLAKAGPLLELSVRMMDWEREAATGAIWLALAKAPQEALRVARSTVQARPDDVELHRVYHWVAERTGHQQEVLEEYRSRAQAQPDSGLAQYLYARLLRGSEGAATMEQLAQRFPQEPQILRSVTYNRWRSGDWKGTLQAWETLRNLSAPDAAKAAEAEALALVALGRRGEALELLKKIFDEEEPGDRAETAELYARIARDGKVAAPDELIAKLEANTPDEENSRRWDLRSRAGLSTEGAPAWTGLRLMSTVGRDPQAAVALAAQLTYTDFHLLSGGGWALAYGEAVRTGAAEPEKALAQSNMLDTASLEVFRRFVRGEAISLEGAELTPEVRAAACFVRSRNTTLPAEERRKLVEQARRDDQLHGTVSEAIATWAP
jgi:hypothetical protein